MEKFNLWQGYYYMSIGYNELIIPIKKWDKYPFKVNGIMSSVITYRNGVESEIQTRTHYNYKSSLYYDFKELENFFSETINRILKNV